MKKNALLITSCLLLNITGSSHAMGPFNGKAVLSLGGFSASQGESQHINIQNLIGNDYTVTQHNNANVLVGLGYFFNGYTNNTFNVAYGISAFYLPQTDVKGNVIWESVFTNLSYRYSVAHVPIYAAAKATIPNNSKKFALTLDAGIGPNIMTTSNYHERSLDGGISIPDHAFKGQTSTVFSAMAGIGVQINNVLGSIPVELGYRFFYLGQGDLTPRTNQILNTLNTGNAYANALVVSVTV